MSNLFNSKALFFLTLIFLLSLQIFVIFLNTKDDKVDISLKNSLDNFETIMFNKQGNSIIKAKKLVYINDQETLLLGNSSLKNDNQEIISSDITINFENGNAESSNKTQFTNKTMDVISDGFIYNKPLSLVKFLGNTKIIFLNE